MEFVNPSMHFRVCIFTRQVALEVVARNVRINGGVDLMPSEFALHRETGYRRLTCSEQDKKGANRYGMPYQHFNREGVRDGISRR